MQPELAARRVLVEVGDPATARAVGAQLSEAGFHAVTCDGRGPGGRGCPLLRGLPCAEVDAAAAIVCALGPGPIADAVAKAGGDRVEMARPADARATVEALHRARARRGRRMRRLLDVHGRRLLVRPIEPGDAARLAAFDGALTERSRRLRYLSFMPTMTPEQADRMATVDFDSRFAFVAVEGHGDERRIVADARLLADPEHPGRADLAVAVADDVQGAGVGPILLHLLVELAAERGFDEVGAEVWWDNQPMVRVLRRLGFQRTQWELGVMTFVRPLGAS